MANQHFARGSSDEELDGEVNMDLDTDSNAASHVAQDTHQPPILVLSRDSNLIETVRKAAQRGCQVADAPDVDRAADLLARVRPGVLLTDTAAASDVAGIVAQFTQHFPDLVVVVAGKREDSAALMQLTAAGQIHRFLLTPLSHGPTRLALDAAVKRHQELVASGDRLAAAAGGAAGSGKNYTPTYIGLATGILVVIGGIWWLVGRMTAVPEAPSTHVAGQPAQNSSAAIPSKPDPVQSELTLAKEAFDQKHYLEPAGESALDLYRSAMALDPKNEQAKLGIRSVADKVLERAESALLAERLEEAVSSLEIARGIQPDHPRFAFLDAQVARERERIQLSQAKDVSVKVRKLLAEAAQKMEDGRLVSPPGDNARESLVDARRLDPTDPNIQQAFRDLAAKVVDEARKAAAAGQMEQAQSLVGSARQLGAAGSMLASVERTLAENKANATPPSATVKKPGSEGPLAVARQRLAAGQLIEPKGDSAKDLLIAARTADPSKPEIAEFSLALSAKLIDAGKQAVAAQQFDRAGVLLSAAQELNARANDPALMQAEHDLEQARSTAAFRNNVVSAGTLKRTRTVLQVYPESARRKNIQGWVEVVFTVTAFGEVTDAEVRNSSPEDVFDQAAIKAVKQWRFEPVMRDGKSVAQRAVVRLKFDSGG